SPSNIKELYQFLGMAVYFSTFIPYYSDLCVPLFNLLRKGTKWDWTAECQIAFENVKQALEKAPVLGHPVEGLPYHLYTDASDDACGCVLQQVQKIKVKDLKNTKAYLKLKKEYDKGRPPP